jgi:hypothetical protein
MVDWSILTEQEKAEILNSLTAVGPEKAIGYLPLYTIRDILQLRPEQVVQASEARGLKTFIAAPAQVKSGALYVYHRDTLSQLLLESRKIVVSAGAPSDADGFVELIASKWFDPGHPLCPLIALAFNDKSSCP